MPKSELPRAVLRAGREKSLRRRHPWVFSGALERIEGDPEPGATIELVTAAGERVARAGYSPSSQIRARVWTFDADEPVDAALVERRIARAVEARRRLGLLEAEGACRLVFAEADGLPGLIVDRYASWLVCQFLTATIEPWRVAIVAALVALVAPRGIYERSEGPSRRKEGLASRRGVLAGAEPPPEIEVRSGGVRELVDVRCGQKTGGYLDQRLNRALVARHGAGVRMLDAFSYTGGFALAALAAGAEHAMLIDASQEALAAARRAAELNGVAARCELKAANAFDELRQLRDGGRRFGLVVLDPPKFVHSADQLHAGSRGYKDVNMLGLQLVEEGGVLATFSCSGHVDAPLFQKIVAGAALDARREVQVLERLSQPPDHPVRLSFPEAEYLLGLVLRIR